MNTEKILYRVIFTGKIKNDEDIEQVKGRFALIYKTTPEKIGEKLFKGKRVVIKKGISLQQAEKLKMDMERKTGAVLYVEEIGRSLPIPNSDDTKEKVQDESVKSISLTQEKQEKQETSKSKNTDSCENEIVDSSYNVVFYGDFTGRI